MLVKNVNTGIIQELRYDVAMRLVERGLYEHVNVDKQAEHRKQQHRNAVQNLKNNSNVHRPHIFQPK